jgi:hypothetical protein
VAIDDGPLHVSPHSRNAAEQRALITQRSVKTDSAVGLTPELAKLAERLLREQQQQPELPANEMDAPVCGEASAAPASDVRPSADKGARSRPDSRRMDRTSKGVREGLRASTRHFHANTQGPDD